MLTLCPLGIVDLNMKIILFPDLTTSDLIVDAIYESTHDGQLKGEALNALLPGVGNQGGFRPSGRGEDKNLVVLFSTGEDKDWPDTLDLNTGQFAILATIKPQGMKFTIPKKVVTKFYGGCSNYSTPPRLIGQRYLHSLSSKNHQPHRVHVLCSLKGSLCLAIPECQPQKISGCLEND